MNSLIIGYGEVGKGIHQVIKDADVLDTGSSLKPSESQYEALLVAIPYTKTFVENVKAYQKKFKVKTTIIFSTVPIGTSRKCNAVHSPVQGKHPRLGDSMKLFKRFIGGKDPLAEKFLKKYFKNITILDKPEFTEFLKLRSTSLYGVNLVFGRYTNEVCEDLGMDYDYVNEFDLAYNELYRDLGMSYFQRYLFTPVKGKILGHCVVPNAKILNKQYPHKYLRDIK